MNTGNLLKEEGKVRETKTLSSYVLQEPALPVLNVLKGLVIQVLSQTLLRIFSNFSQEDFSVLIQYLSRVDSPSIY